jgi:hypothetical protein
MEISALIVSRVTVRDNGTNDYECLLRETQRNYQGLPSGLVSQGFFALEVVVEQLVHVTHEGDLSFAQVAEIVKTGFGRGFGGRIQFRALLQNYTDFAAIEDIEAMDDVSPSQEAPSPEPSVFPSDVPSHTPTVAPSSFPTETLSMPPSALPTVVASQPPTIFPSATLSSSPSSMPVQRDRQPLIVLAIAGGLATIFVSLFFIFCVWYPLCSGWKVRENEDGRVDHDSPPPQRPNNAPTPPTISYSSQTAVPEMLTLADDSWSIGNTTVTIGDKSSMGPKTKPASHVGSTDARVADSFDEGSVYTTGAVSDVEGGAPSSSSVLVGSVKSQAMEDTATDEYETYKETLDKVTIVEPVANLDDHELMTSEPDDAPFHTNSDTKGFNPFEAGADVDDESSFGFASRGFDPPVDDGDDAAGDDDSSFGFGSSIALSDPSFGHQTVENSVKVSLSSNSAKTKGIANVTKESLKAMDPIDDAVEGWQWNQTVGAEGDDALSIASHAASTDRSNSLLRANDRLLRSLLEGASRDLARKSSSAKSRVSLQSAPSRLLSQRANISHRSMHTHCRPPPYVDNHFTGNLDSMTFASSSRSVGSIPRTRLTMGSQRLPVVVLNQVGVRDHELFEVFTASPINRPVLNDERLWGTPSPSGRRLLIEDYNLVTPESEEKVLGARPRRSTHDDSAETGPDTPVATTGILGISGQPAGTSVDSPTRASISPWFTVDGDGRTLGARRRDSGGSSSSHSSRSEISANMRNSAGSIGSMASESTIQSGRAGIDAAYRRSRMESPQSLASTLESRLEEYKRADMAPRSLEHELSRLEMHRSTGSRGQTTISSVAESSFADSRSTLSSRMEPRKSDEVRVVVFAPPGKIDVVLTNRHDGKGTFVAEVRPSSSLVHKLSPGDKLGKDVTAKSTMRFGTSTLTRFLLLIPVAVDGVDVTKMPVGRITALMAFRASQERRLTVVTTSPLTSSVSQETKHDSIP